VPHYLGNFPYNRQKSIIFVFFSSITYLVYETTGIIYNPYSYTKIYQYLDTGLNKSCTAIPANDSICKTELVTHLH